LEASIKGGIVNTQVQISVDLSGTLAGDLHAVLREAAKQGPLATDVMTGATVVLRQRDLEVLAHDPRLNGIGLSLFDMMGITDGPLRDWYGRLMFTTEGDYHRRMRSLVSRAFTPRSVEVLHSTAAKMAAQAVGSVRHGGDLVAACSSLGTRLTCRLLGVPDADVAVFTQWAEALSPVFFVMTPEQISAATAAITDLQSYVDDLTRRRADDPGPDLITALLAAEADGERLTHAETVTMIANLLIAGHDTTGSQIPCSILVALQHRDELAGAHQDEARLTSAVAETMRLEPSIPAIPRTAVEPIELHGMTIPVGQMVLLCIAAASRDGSAWNDPDDFDPDRFT
jgi:cytochrome P450